MLVSGSSTDLGVDLNRVLSGSPVTLRLPGMPGRRVQIVSGFLYRVLSELDLGFLSEMTLVLLREITGNYAKAHAKRLFFEENDLDIHNPAHYRSGLERFGSDVLVEWEEFRERHVENDFYIDLTIRAGQKFLTISLENNCPIVPQEWERIQARLAIFRKYSTLEGAMEHIRDESEGAGLGIVLSLLMLNNAGIPPDNFQIQSTDRGAVTILDLPRKPGSPRIHQAFREEALERIESLPSFPEHLARLIRMCDSELSSVQGIANEIQKDPALTSELLRMVNSAGYMHRWNNPTLADAVKIVGLKVLRNLLMAHGARHVITSHFRVRDLEALWAHSNRVSFYARILAGENPIIAEHASLAGLLYNLGRIVLLAMRPDVVERLQKLSRANRARKSAVLEEITLGISHPEIGALLAEKWQFPPALVAAIRHQQQPLQVSVRAYRDLVWTVYLAIRILEADENVHEYFLIEGEILGRFNMNSADEFLERARSLANLYDTVGAME